MKNSSFDIKGGLKIRDRGLGFFYQIWGQDFTSENPSPGCKENNFYNLPFGQAEANIY